MSSTERDEWQCFSLDAYVEHASAHDVSFSEACPLRPARRVTRKWPNSLTAYLGTLHSLVQWFSSRRLSPRPRDRRFFSECGLGTGPMSGTPRGCDCVGSVVSGECRGRNVEDECRCLSWNVDSFPGSPGSVRLDVEYECLSPERDAVGDFGGEGSAAFSRLRAFSR